MKKALLTLVVVIGFAITAFSSVTIAVLPYSVNYQGRIPRKFETPEQIAEATRQDGETYQTSMINYLTRMSNKRKYAHLDINVIGQVQIDAMLRKAGIDAAVTTLSNEQLAEALGVTHVVRGSLTRTFIMSDELALGVGVVGVLSGQPVNTATSSMNITNALEDMETNAVVFSRQSVRTTKPTRGDESSLRGAFRGSSRAMLRKIKKSN